MKQLYVGSLLLFAILIFAMLVIKQQNHLVEVKRTLNPPYFLPYNRSAHFQQEITDFIIGFINYRYPPADIRSFLNFSHSAHAVDIFAPAHAHSIAAVFRPTAQLPEEKSAVDLLSGFKVGRTGLTYSFTIPSESITPTMEFGMETDDILKSTWVAPKAAIEITVPIR